MKTERLALALSAVNLVVLGVVLLTRPSTAKEAGDVLRGRALEIVDAKGVARARITLEPATTVDGKTYPEATVLRLADSTGRTRVKLAGDEEGAGMVFADDADYPGVHLLVENKSERFFKLIDKDGREKVLRP